MANFWRVLEFDKFAGEWPLLSIKSLPFLSQLVRLNPNPLDLRAQLDMLKLFVKPVSFFVSNHLQVAKCLVEGAKSLPVRSNGLFD